jgi:hypothetical protein
MTLPAYDASNPSAYVESRLALVEGRDTVALLEDAPSRIASVLEGVTEEAARRPKAPGAWSILQVLRHLADSEIVYGYRLRQIVASDRPAIAGYDQEDWAGTLEYHRGTVADALEDYASARRGTVRFLRSLPEAAWERVGLHSERGEESVRRTVALLAAHDIGHEQQIGRVRSILGV